MSTIEIDTPIVPEAVAETVTMEIENAVNGSPLEPLAFGPALIRYLVVHAKETYQSNLQFRRKIRARGDKGRDYLYTFMRHWAASYLRRHKKESLLTRVQFERLANGLVP